MYVTLCHVTIRHVTLCSASLNRYYMVRRIDRGTDKEIEVTQLMAATLPYLSARDPAQNFLSVASCGMESL